MSSFTIQNDISLDELLQHVEGMFIDENNPIANMANMASLLYWSVPDINWVGFYLRHDGELVLGPFHGKPACVRISFGRGVCGSAAVKKETLIVDDVMLFQDHIVCDARSRSEIVVPMMNGDMVFGVLDVDSPVVKRFSQKEKTFFQDCVSLLIDASIGWKKYYFI